MITYHCDFCRKENIKGTGPGHLPNIWKEIKCSISYNQQTIWHACPNCAERLGIKDISPGTEENYLNALKELIGDNLP